MKIFKSINDLSEFIQRSLDSTKEALDGLLGKGFKGGLKDVFDFSAQGLIQKADFDLGIGILHLMMNGDQAAVDTAIEFRKALAEKLHELDEMTTLVRKFKAEDPGEIKKAADEMGAFLARRGQGDTNA